MSRLYTYLPKDNTALTEGLLSTALALQGFEKYRGRTGKHTKKDVLKVLDSWEPEWTRSKAISALTQPIPSDAAEDFLNFAKDRKLYSFDTKDLIKAKILAHIRRARKGGGTDPVDDIKKERLNWHRKKKHLLFQGVPHYFVETTGGKIPPEFIREEKMAEDKDEKSLERARAFVAAVKKMALKRKLNMFLVTDGASGILNNGNPAVRNAREAQIKWELEHGHDPYELWEHNEKRAVSFSQDGSTFQLAAGETPGHAVKAWNSKNPTRQITTRQLLSANKGVKATGYVVGKMYNTGIAVTPKPVVSAHPVIKPAPTNPASPPPGTSVQSTSTSRLNHIAARLHSKLNNPNLEAGILANFDRETGGRFDYSTKQIGGGGGYGLPQYTGPTLKSYRNWLATGKLKDSADNQVDYFVDHYMPTRSGYKTYTAPGAKYTKEQYADWLHRKVFTPAHTIPTHSAYSKDKITQITRKHNAFMQNKLKPVGGVWQGR